MWVSPFLWTGNAETLFMCFPGTTANTNSIMLVSLAHMTLSMADNTLDKWLGQWLTTPFPNSMVGGHFLYTGGPQVPSMSGLGRWTSFET